MTHSIKLYQHGITLIDLMVGITIGLLVVMVATGSLMATRVAGRTISDSAALEQKASLIMLQIGQQITQAGAVVAISNSGDAVSDMPYISFDTSAIGGINAVNPSVSIYGADGGAGSDSLVVSYTAPNDTDGAVPARNCIGTSSTAVGTQERVVSQFFIDGTNLVCNNDTATPSTAAKQPIASNVVAMKVKYLLINGSDQVTLQNASAGMAWANVVGVQICLEVQGDPTNAPPQTLGSGDCRGNVPYNTPDDKRIHRVVKQTFYLRNISS
jgi:type IV pilus assembly protein PilW